MSKKLKNNNLGLLGGVVVVAVFSVVGLIMLKGGSAATFSPAGFFNYASISNPTTGVFTSTDIVPGIGTQTVGDIAPGNKLVFSNFLGKVGISSTCYYVRAYNSPKSAVQASSGDVQFVGSGSAATVTVPANDNYYTVCVPAGKKAQLQYNIANLSPSIYVLVYQAVNQYN